MKKFITIFLVLLLSVSFLFAGGKKEEKQPVAPHGAPQAPEVVVQEPAKPEEPEAEQIYYLTGSFNNYMVAPADYIMKKLPSDSQIYQDPNFKDADLYYFTVPAENMKPDEVNDGHYYKVSLGDWNHVYGIEVYEMQPPPIHENYGLGSIYIPIDYKDALTVVYDAKTHKIYDNTMKQDIVPRLYGNFKTAFDMMADWSMDEDNSILLDKTGEGVWEKTFTLPAYKGSPDDPTGAEIFLTWSRMYYLSIGAGYDYMTWGALGQAAVEGIRSESQQPFKPDQEATYKVTYTEATGEITMEKVQ